jgi:hypothetical protein
MLKRTDPLVTYLCAGRSCGCPEDQMFLFASAGVILQRRQLAASAAARLCDSPGGPTEIGFGGARGGGKSYWLLAQMGVDDCQRFPGLKCLLLRRVGKANIEWVRKNSLQSIFRVPGSLDITRGRNVASRGVSVRSITHSCPHLTLSLPVFRTHAPLSDLKQRFFWGSPTPLPPWPHAWPEPGKVSNPVQG